MTTTTDELVQYNCTHANHPREIHRHFIDAHENVLYSRNLDGTSTSSTRVEGAAFVRDGTLPDWVDETTETTETTSFRPTLGLTLPAQTFIGCAAYTPALVFPAAEEGVRSTEWLVLGPSAWAGYRWDYSYGLHLPEEQRDWIAAQQRAARDRGSNVYCSWVPRRIVRTVGPLPDAERFFTDEEYAFTQVPRMVRSTTRSLEASIAAALKEEKSEREWCSELEDEWLPQMRLDKSTVRTAEYRTFEVEVTATARSTITHTQTVTIEIDGRTNEEVREDALNRAWQDLAEDLREEVDFGGSEYVRASVEYGLDDQKIEEEFDSDEDGDSLDD